MIGKKHLLAALTALLAIVAAVLFSRPDIQGSLQLDNTPKSDFVAFEKWLDEEPGRRAEYAAFASSLDASGVAHIVPAWTLLRTDNRRIARCGGEPFVIPPREKWRAVVPALRIIREKVIPAIGEVEVVSAYRTEEFNQCAGGASASRHLSFAALDLVPTGQSDAKQTFAALCAAWREAGPNSRWGLGAYFDPDRPKANQDARFHVDGTGWRSWGYDYSGASSGCDRLN